ncbi:MAG: cyclic-di-AMP receptor [Armatimonadota bacterium]
MKLIIAVIHDRDKHRAMDALRHSGFKFTQVASTGGFLREGNVTLLIGTEDEEVEQVLNLIRENCKTREQFVNLLPPDTSQVGAFIPSPVKVLVGGAIAFVLDVERFERF